MSNVLSEQKRQQVIALGRLGWSLRRIEKETGVRRETASKYLQGAGVPVRPPGSWGRRRPKPANEVSPDPESVGTGVTPKPANEVSPDPEPGRSPSASACEPFREQIEEGLRLGRNGKVIWEDLVEKHGFTAGYSSVKRFVRAIRGRSGPDAQPVIVTQPGEEAQVDYGEGPMVRHPETGKYRRTRLFVLTLGYSRKSIRLLRFKSSSQVWAQLHEEAFRRLGGAPRVVVLDNLKEGVLKPDHYDPALNPLYRDVLAHYGVAALPCRVRHADRKGKVESGVNYAQQKLKGLRFEALEEAQRYLDRWEERWADTRIHGTTKRQVGAVFAEEKPHLLPLPVEPFRYYRYGVRSVHLDGCVEVERAYYSAPPGRVGTRVHVQWDERVVRLIDLHTGALLVEHRRQRKGWYRIRKEHEPKRTPQKLRQILAQADLAGRHVGRVCQAIHNEDGDYGTRRILGVIALVKKHGAASTDHACAFALESGVPTYRFVRRYLERQPSTAEALKQVAPLIRQLTDYTDRIRQLTEETP